MTAFTFNELLERNGVDPKEVYLIRHTKSENNENMRLCRMKNMLFEATRIQSISAKFRGQDFPYWAVFDDDGKDRARLLWFCRNNGHVPLTADNLPEGYPAKYLPEDQLFDLERLDTLHDYEQKLVIDWGKSPRTFARPSVTDAAGAIISIGEPTPKAFPGFDRLILDFNELVEVMEAPGLYGAWEKTMSSVAAIYLIADKRDGGLYIGSASGENGLWGRWQGYAQTNGTNGNALLEKLVGQDPDRCYDLRYSVLRVLDPTTRRSDIIHMESLYKEKLCTRAHILDDGDEEANVSLGLNAN